MTSKEALGNLRFNVSMSQDIDYKEANNECDIIEKDLDKLGQLEDIEEELGIDLVKLLSAKSIFVDEKSVFYNFKISVIEQCVYVSVDDCDDTKLSFDDYGKTWAFTKEEIKNDRI